MKKILYILFLLAFFSVKSQILTEKNAAEFIKTIIFKTSEDNKNQFPIVRLNEPFTLQFDDLNADQQTYYYTITHCNADWSVSELLKSQYIKGIDEQPIQPESNSYVTLQPYSHYRLTLPNDLTKITLTGNYMLSISDSYGTEIFSRRFVVYNPLLGVQSEVKRSRNLQLSENKQVIQFSIKQQNMLLQDPQSTLKIAVLQNYHWGTAITDLKPQYTMGNELIYRYDLESSFDAGNEYFNFDSKDLRATSTGILNIEQSQLYEIQLFTNTIRSNRVYTYNPDINGDFLVNTLNGQTASNEADYVWVHFSLEADPSFWNKEVFVYGKFSNYELSDIYRLYYDQETGLFHGKILLKQGFYNYKFVTKEKNEINFNEIDGNFHQTENNYLILVYYRPIGTLYDQVIGVGSTNSTTISR